MPASKKKKKDPTPRPPLQQTVVLLPHHSWSYQRKPPLRDLTILASLILHIIQSNSVAVDETATYIRRAAIRLTYVAHFDPRANRDFT